MLPAPSFFNSVPATTNWCGLILGHHNVQTTIRCYIGLKEIQATQIFGKIIKDRLTINSE